MLTDRGGRGGDRGRPGPTRDRQLRGGHRQRRPRCRHRARYPGGQHTRRAHRDHRRPRPGADARAHAPPARGRGRGARGGDGSPGSRHGCWAATSTAPRCWWWGRGGSAARWRGGWRVSAAACSPPGGTTQLGPLLGEADVVTLHCPLTPETRGLIGCAELAAMKPTAYLVNTARGPIVDTDAAGGGAARRRDRRCRAGRDRPRAAAGRPPADPGARACWWCPHIASATHATREAMADMAVDNLLAALAGERMPHCANPEVYER